MKVNSKLRENCKQPNTHVIRVPKTVEKRTNINIFEEIMASMF